MAGEIEFDLVFALPEGAATDEGTVLDALHEAGCDDAAVGLGAPGLVGLGFRRAGPDPEATIRATAERVASALPAGADLREARPDLAGLAQAAHG